MICSKCGAKLYEDDSFCKLCGGEGIEPSIPPESEFVIENKTETTTNIPNKVSEVNVKKETCLRIGGILCAVFLMLGIFFCFKGFDCKNNYYNSEYSSSLNKNAYVGGDAYNYIINGTYFTGYLTLGGSSLICSITCLCSCAIIYILQDKKTEE